jgi:putative ABC transport system ATP-binding protein
MNFALFSPIAKQGAEPPAEQSPAAQPERTTLERNLARYIWTNTRYQQLWILAVVLLSMPTYFMSFDLPKQIVNGPIQGQGFETPEATQTFLKIDLNWPDWLTSAPNTPIFSGFELSRLQLLLALSGVFLVLVIVNGLFKLYINTYKGRLGERMLRRLRYDLVDRIVRFPPSVFKRKKASERATMVKDEVEPLGGFIGDAFVSPALLGGQAVTALVFILVQNLWLGLMAASMIGIQGFIIPILRRRFIIPLGRQRQLTARQLAGRVGEIVDGIPAVHVNDTSNYERADIAERLGRIFKIRYDLYQWKFFVKFLNNFLAQLTPFLFYSVGGYLALRGQLDIGQLVAVISAYKDLPGPIKELIDWDQSRVDVQVKYAQVVEQFHVDQILDPKLQPVVVEEVPPITTPISVVNLSATDDSGAKLLENISLEVKPGERVAIVGTPGGGSDALGETLARLLWPDSGRVSLANGDLYQLPEAITGRRMGYASSDAHLIQGSVRDNLLYALKHAPMRDYPYEGTRAAQRRWEIDEAKRAGNPLLDIRADWIDYEAAGARGPDDLFPAIERVLKTVSLTQDIFDLGLRTSLESGRESEIVSRIKEVRAALRARLEAENMTELVVPFELDAYNQEATVAENLLFGSPVGTTLAGRALASNPYFRSVLAELGLEEALYKMGLEIARNVVELFRDLPPDHPFFQQLTFMTADELPAYQALLQKLQDVPFERVSAADREQIIGLSFSYIEPRYRFGLLDPPLMHRIVEARQRFREGLPPELRAAIEPYDPETYNRSASVLDNVLFGRIGHRHADAADRVRVLVRDILGELGLSDDVVSIGLDYDVGVGGKRLSAGQRQKIHLARALLKRPDILILNKPLSALDIRAQEQAVRAVLKEGREEGRKPTILWILASPSLAGEFDRVVVLDRGTSVEDGSYDDLVARKGTLSELLAA